MAVAIRLPSRNQSVFSEPKLGSRCLQSLSRPMIATMSYQYPPPPPQDGTEMDLPHAGYYATPSASSMEGANDADNGHLALSNSEKRRNKLGYHRTSVACGHCRRRKIRCILQPADPGGRCMNCIRLKKECSFFPVDQQPPTLPGQKQGTRSSVGSKIPSASSSPAMATGQPPEAARHQLYPQLNTTQSMQHMGPPTMQHATADTYPVTPEVPGSASGTRGYEFGHGVSDWITTDASGGNTAKNMDDLNAPWRTYPQTSPVTPAFSPYTHDVPAPATWSAVSGSAALTAGVVGEAGSRAEDVAWGSYSTATTRSMSYSGSGGDPHEAYSPMAGARTFDSHRRSSTTTAYPSIISTGGVAAGDSAVDHHAASLSAGAGPPPNYGTWSPHSYGGAYGRRTDGYGSVWYNEGTAGAPETSGGGETIHPHAGALYYGGR